LEARAAATLQHKSKYDLWKFYLMGQYGEQNELRSVAEVKGGIYFEHLFGERPFAYMRNEAEYDEFENIDLRYTLIVGGGYYWLKEPTHQFKTFAGVGYLHETYSNGETRDDPQGEVGLEYMVDLTEWLKFTHNASWYPTFESLSDYRLVFDTAFLMPLGTSDKWKLKLGATHEYDSIPQPGLERLDQTYYANILLELK
jgi:putative salt-induced outer membrane protein YdiY